MQVKQMLEPASVNMVFMLTVFGGYSVSGLILLFTLKIVVIGLGFHFVYKAVNDEKSELVSDIQYEEVSIRTLQKIFVKEYEGKINFFYTLVDMLCIEDPAKTLAFLTVVNTITLWLWIFNVGDKTVAWAIYNSY